MLRTKYSETRKIDNTVFLIEQMIRINAYGQWRECGYRVSYNGKKRWLIRYPTTRELKQLIS